MGKGTLGEPLVVLIGGGSGTGKTTVAATLSQALSMPYAQADDFRLFGQRITSPAEHPELHFFVDQTGVGRSEVPPAHLVQRLAAIAKVVSRGLEVVIAHHLATRLPLIIEGDAIWPDLGCREAYADTLAGGRVRAVFLYERDESLILDSMRRRGRDIERLPEAEQQRAARVAWLYGRRIARQAARRGLPVIDARPHSILAARVVDVLD